MPFKFLKIIKSPTKELLEILNNNIIGTPGHGMLYQHLGVENKINKIANPYYVNLERNNKIIGTCCFCSRITSNRKRKISSFYIRYFSFKDLYRRKHTSEKVVSGNSVLREEIKSILTGQDLGKDMNEIFFFYAYVDPRNLRSLLLCNEFGFETVRQYTSIIFNRINPKVNQAVQLVSPNEENTIKELLADFYKEYNMFSFENLFNGRPYYTIKDESGKIVAGVQLNPDLWKIHSLHGLSGKIILNTFSHIPILDRFFNKNYRFIALEGIYYIPGYEKHLETLFESLLAEYKVNSAIICLDADSSLYKTIKSLKLGMVDKLNKEVKGNVICKFVKFDEDDKKIFKSNPAYISGIDVT
ncbi:MAG TPA: hypothetical protein VNB90_15195 [Cytophagaceae bacterium]|jgi:hypothetical protein|nr:hypothetical protein [Cytophagaceae bacterium]